MAQIVLPTIDSPACTGWSEQDRDLYNKLPFYLVKMQLEYLKTWSVWPKLVGKVKWQPNMGDTMRAVSKEPSPHLRQVAFPNRICSTPKKDIMQVRERTVDALTYRQRFESPIMNFCPSFQDFLTDHVMRTSQDINEKISRFNDVYIRSNIFQQSPYVFWPNRENGELKVAPYDSEPTSTYDYANKRTTVGGDGKTTAWLQAQLVNIGNPGNLSLNAINLAVMCMQTDMRILPFKGTGTPGGDNAPLNAYYVLVLSGEAYGQFIYDPWLLRNKNIELDVVKEGFKGSLFGMVTCKLEDLPMRISADGTLPDPETVELNPAAFNYGESVPSAAYLAAPYEVAFLVGQGDGYKAIEIGPPPKDFAGNGMPKGFGNMFWNAETIITKNILVPCQDADGNMVWDTNKYGEQLQIIAQGVFGIVGEQKRSIIPIIFKRWRGAKSGLLA